MVGKGSKPGERRGGRQKGTPNKATAARLKQAEASGAMPLDVMLDAMRWHYSIALTERQKGGLADIGVITASLDSAADKAKDLAPYYHPRLTTVQSNVNLTGRLTLEQLVEASLKASLPANDDEGMKLIEGEAIKGDVAE